MSPFRDDSSTGSLAELQPGFPAAVLSVGGDNQPMCLRLQELGLVPGASVEVLSRSSGLLICVGEQRLCLGVDLAGHVEVLPL